MPLSPGISLRDYRPADGPAVDALALRAFADFADAYDDWPGFRAKIAHLSALADSGELIVGEASGEIVGAVAYVGPGQPKAAFFQPEWPIMRMLVVDPAHRGQGLGRALAEACLAHARRDGAPVFALHTSPLMSIALPLYERMGFTRIADAPLIHGVPYGVYLKSLVPEPGEK